MSHLVSFGLGLLVGLVLGVVLTFVLSAAGAKAAWRGSR